MKWMAGIKAHGETMGIIQGCSSIGHIKEFMLSIKTARAIETVNGF